MVSGVDYKIDLTQPIGNRIKDLKFKGKNVSDGMLFTMALNSYRQSGGGGYDMIKNCEVIYNKQESIRDLLINYVQQNKNLIKNDIFVKNWELILK